MVKIAENLYLIGGTIYVLGMFLMFYFYWWQGVVNPGYIAFPGIIGALLALSQMFFATGNDKTTEKPSQISTQKN